MGQPPLNAGRGAAAHQGALTDAPVAEDVRERVRKAADRIRRRRERLPGAPLADLVRSIHEGHRY